MIQVIQSIKEQNRIYKSGFTIVELLIVVVVIGILATISFVAYSGVTQSAAVAVLKSDIKNAQTELELEVVKTGSYPEDGGNLPRSKNTLLEYTRNGGAYCITASSVQAGTSYYLDSTIGGVTSEGACDDHEASGIVPGLEPDGLTITSPSSLPTAYMMGDSYSYDLTTTGEGPVSFNVTDGSLPSGLTLNQSTGAITGQVNTSSLGTSNFTITATDNTGSNTKDFSIKGYPFDSCNDPLPSSFEPIVNASTGVLTIQAYVTLCGTSSPMGVLPSMSVYYNVAGGSSKFLGTMSNGYISSLLITTQEACSGASVRYIWGTWTSDWVDVIVNGSC